MSYKTDIKNFWVFLNFPRELLKTFHILEDAKVFSNSISEETYVFESSTGKTIMRDKK